MTPEAETGVMVPHSHSNVNSHPNLEAKNGFSSRLSKEFYPANALISDF